MLFAAVLAAPTADSVIGTWHSPTKNGVIAIQHCGASICGTVQGGDDLKAHPDVRDVNNRDVAKRGRPIRGLTMLSGFRWADGAWSGGQVYDPSKGATYSGRITPVDANTLKLRGCIIWPACRTETWTRIR